MRSFVRVMAVNIEDKIPIVRVTAKPLITPCPNMYRKKAAIRVVRLESRMVAKAWVKPCLIAYCGVEFIFSSSLIRSKIRTFVSTAMPRVRMIPAIPGMVRVAWIMPINATMKTRLMIAAMLAKIPK